MPISRPFAAHSTTTNSSAKSAKRLPKWQKGQTRSENLNQQPAVAYPGPLRWSEFLGVAPCPRPTGKLRQGLSEGRRCPAPATEMGVVLRSTGLREWPADSAAPGAPQDRRDSRPAMPDTAARKQGTPPLGNHRPLSGRFTRAPKCHSFRIDRKPKGQFVKPNWLDSSGDDSRAPAVALALGADTVKRTRTARRQVVDRLCPSHR